MWQLNKLSQLEYGSHITAAHLQLVQVQLRKDQAQHRQTHKDRKHTLTEVLHTDNEGCYMPNSANDFENQLILKTDNAKKKKISN